MHLKWMLAMIIYRLVNRIIGLKLEILLVEFFFDTRTMKEALVCFSLLPCYCETVRTPLVDPS